MSLHAKEHELIERGLRILGVIVRELETGREVKPELVEKLWQFFSDVKVLHIERENLLLPPLEGLGVAEKGLADIIRVEHEKVKEKIKLMQEAWARYVGGDDGAREALIATAKEFEEFLRSHKTTEEILFRRAELSLPREALAALATRCLEFEREKLGASVVERYSGLIEELEELALGRRKFHE